MARVNLVSTEIVSRGHGRQTGKKEEEFGETMGSKSRGGSFVEIEVEGKRREEQKPKEGVGVWA